MNIETANHLYELRKKNGLSQEELADKLGISRQAVSKWERAEASPDTDNLILLAKLYNVSLDELLNAEKASPNAEENKYSNEDPEDDEDKEDDEDPVDDEDTEDDEGTYYHETKPSDSVTVTEDGIKVTSDDEEILIKKHGIKVIDKNGNEKYFKRIKINKRKSLLEDILSGSIALLCVVAYLVLGFTLPYGWSVYWTVFLLIPIVPSIFEAIRKRRFCTFAYPVFVAMIYLFMGMRFKDYTYTIFGQTFTGFFHPLWIIFVTIPLYYCIFGPIDRVLHNGEEDIEELEDLEGFEDVIDIED